MAEECVMEDAGSATVSTQGATSADATATACGTEANAGSSYSGAVGYQAQADLTEATVESGFTDGALAFGARAVAVGFNTIALGNDARVGSVTSSNESTTTYGFADYSTAVGADSRVSAAFGTAIGKVATVSAQGGSAIGAFASASGLNGIAFGTDADINDGSRLGASASGENSIAIGTNAGASAVSSTAMGTEASASGSYSSAIGFSAETAGLRSTAMGTFASANARDATAVGRSATASAVLSSAFGYEATASSGRAVAVGTQAVASGSAATAIGTSAQAAYNNSTAIGFEATTTAANQLTLGGANSSVRVGDIDASTAAQDGQLYAVTVDDAGTLGRGSALATSQQVASLATEMQAVAAVTDAQFSALQADVDSLSFQLDDLDETTRGGIAAAMALGGQMVVPDSTVSVTVNGSTYRGEQGFAGSVAARVAPRIYLSGGIAGSTAKKSTGGRVGVAFGF